MDDKYRVSFFATKEDLASVFELIRSQRSLRFVKTGFSSSPEVEVRHSLFELPDLGIAAAADPNHGPSYLIADAGTVIEMECVPQRRGGVMYAVDQLYNPKTVAFWPGGIFEHQVLIAGEVSTISENDPASLDLLRLFRNTVRGQFSRIKSFYVGREAFDLLNSGWRLTANAKLPPELDLKVD